MGKRLVDPCSVEDCDTLITSKDLCQKHYLRKWKSGSTDPVVRTPGQCTVDECKTELLTLKLGLYCDKHYRRLKLYGDVHIVGKAWADYRVGQPERFWARVDKSAGPTECWVWQGRKAKRSGVPSAPEYGQVYIDKRHMSVHRYSYELATGTKLEGHTPVHHTCSNSLCVQPLHLQAITPEENTAEMLERRWYKARIAELEGRLEKCTCGC